MLGLKGRILSGYSYNELEISFAIIGNSAILSASPFRIAHDSFGKNRCYIDEDIHAINEPFRLKYLFFAILILTACGKHERNPELDKLPAATKTGANTCGCLINGKAIVGEPESASYLGTLFLAIKNNDNSRINLTIRGESIAAGKAFAISNLSYANFGTDDCNFFTNDGNGRIAIDHFDQSSKIVSGRFSFAAANDSCGSVSLTDCRFDFRFYP